MKQAGKTKRLAIFGILKIMKKTDFNKIKPIDLLKAKKIHFIGVGGIGLSAIAKLMSAQGKNISGSDASESEITAELKKARIKIFIGQKSDNLADDTELVIYTLAIPKNNPERVKAEKLKIPMLAYPKALALLFNDKYGIAIGGTHGKSTTTSMVSLILAGGGLDPSVVVGSKVPEFGGNLRLGKSKYFVIEACEYERAFLNYYPKIIVLNNIELDHTDYYRDIDDYRSAFEEFIGHLPKNGVLIVNGDDENISKIKNQKSKLQIKDKKIKKISFGFGENNDVKGYDFKTETGKVKFKVKVKEKELGEFTLKIPGKFNVYNALAAIAVGLCLVISADKIRKSLADFGGIWRRFEVKGEYKGATVISDYAHHPTAVRSTIEAAREFYPGRRIMAVFQPHQRNRTKMLYQDFLKSFDSADMLILAEIFEVAGREEKKDQNVSSRKMARDIKERLFVSVIASEPSGERGNPADSAINAGLLRRSNDCIVASRNDNSGIFLHSKNIFYAPDLFETRKLIDEKIKAGDILLIMGAGDIYKLADELVKKNKICV